MLKTSIITIFISLFVAVSCDDGGGGGGGGGDAPTEDPSVEAPPRYEEPDPVTETEVVKSDVNFGLTRFTPEQYFKNLRTKLNLSHAGALGELETNAYSGREFDFLLLLYAVPLGGIDYVSAVFRDPSTKAQTVLIARQLAWQMSALSVNYEAGLVISNREVFKDYDIDGAYERPFMSGDEMLSQPTQDLIRAGETRWENQIKEMYWRFFSRPASTQEIADIKSAFTTVYQNEGDDNRRAWASILYAFMSSQEFWHL